MKDVEARGSRDLVRNEFCTKTMGREKVFAGEMMIISLCAY